MNVAIYARVSTPEQTPENQILKLLNIAKGRGYSVIGEYVDIASGANQKRPQLDKLLQDAKHGLFNGILVTKIDRLARSITNLLYIMEELQSCGVGVEFVDQPINTNTASGKMVLVIIGALAEFERELIHDRTIDGLERAKAEGRKGGRPARKLTPYQIDKAKAILAQNPQISITNLAKQFTGISRQTLTKLLREEGIII